MADFAVVFDMDGVIFDSEKLVIECWKKVADKYGIPDIENTMMKCLGLNAQATERVVKDRYGEDFDYKRFKEENSALFHSIADGGNLPVKDGVRELLQWLKSNDIKVALATSTRKASVIQELTDAKLIDYFDEIVCGDMVSKSKPDPEIYLKACELLEIKPEDAYAIEDSFNGIRSAYSAGMKPIMVPDLVQPDDEIRGKSLMVMESLLFVLAFFKSVV